MRNYSNGAKGHFIHSLIRSGLSVPAKSPLPRLAGRNWGKWESRGERKKRPPKKKFPKKGPQLLRVQCQSRSSSSPLHHSSFCGEPNSCAVTSATTDPAGASPSLLYSTVPEPVLSLSLPYVCALAERRGLVAQVQVQVHVQVQALSQIPNMSLPSPSGNSGPRVPFTHLYPPHFGTSTSTRYSQRSFFFSLLSKFFICTASH